VDIYELSDKSTTFDGNEKMFEMFEMFEMLNPISFINPSNFSNNF